ncbi:nuclear transport factor 2 family protein [Pedobacter arcticus]|uniref:nuclear transport factor 2 family protein n=1 Tax=Pedobacter arcticus TaxID=752140 RepID=UPI00031833EB|nr:nuclear transport factor 2 family protein [Pedobacter arcticus]
MKKIVLLALIISMINVNLKAQDKKAEVENAVTYLINSLISGRQADLEYIANDNLSYGHSSGKIQNKKEFVQALVTNQSDFVTIDITKQSIQLDGNTAIVRHNLYAKTNDSGNPGEVYLGIMLVFTKQKNGEWKLLARQAYKV